MRGINPKYLAKLDPDQQRTALTGPGKMFLDEFVFMHGEHLYIVGPTGSGKTNKAVNVLAWLKHTETIVWISSGKNSSEEILPLLFQDMPVRIICPSHNEIVIEERREKIDPHPLVIKVERASSAWWAVRKGWINIFEFRNGFAGKQARMSWMVELFQSLADWIRTGNMPPGIMPMALFMDESQWIISGTHVSSDSERMKTTETIAELFLEVRSAGVRGIFITQGFMNAPPAIRENLPCVILCTGAEVDSGVSKKLAEKCNPHVPGWRKSFQWKRNEAKFVTREGKCSPNDKPWPWPWYPKSEADQERMSHMRVISIGHHDMRPESAEVEDEMLPELGRYAALAIPPDRCDPAPSLSEIPPVEVNDD